MDVRIETAAMAANAEVKAAVVITTACAPTKWFSLLKVAVSVPVPSIGGTSISAVSPDTDFNVRSKAAL